MFSVTKSNNLDGGYFLLSLLLVYNYSQRNFKKRNMNYFVYVYQLSLEKFEHINLIIYLDWK